MERNRRKRRTFRRVHTDESKAITRRNSIRHGLTANPAAGTVVDDGLFDDLQAELIETIEPRNVVEAGLVHRIAVCLWRLQRAAEVEAAPAPAPPQRLRKEYGIEAETPS